MTEVQGEAALGISIQSQVSGVRQVVFQTHVPAATSKEELDKLLDTLAEVCDRQEAFYQIDIAQQEHDRATKMLEDMQYRLDNVDHNARVKHEASGRRTPFKLSAQEETAKIQVADQLRIAKENVGKTSARLEELKKKAGTRHGSAADRQPGVSNR